MLPYQVPISVRLTNEIILGVPETNTLNKALKDYHKSSTSLHKDMTILHGVLHLSGMDHENDRGQMKKLETKWRKALALPAGLIERSRR